MSLKSVFVSTTLISALLITIFIGVVVTQPNKIQVTNNSPLLVDKAEIIVAGESYFLSNISSQSKSGFWYLFRGGDSDFKVMLYFKNGKNIIYSDGYMTSGMFLQTTDITIKPDLSIELMQ